MDEGLLVRIEQPGTIDAALNALVYHGGDGGPRAREAMSHALAAAREFEKASEEAERLRAIDLDMEQARWRARSRVTVSHSRR
ncbi:MAG TPA: hypothetical protein VJJ46_09675 [Anaerolineales bacterium]|nr:hypothetical protein [Anaerolineales bacterium]